MTDAMRQVMTAALSVAASIFLDEHGDEIANAYSPPSTDFMYAAEEAFRDVVAERKRLAA